MIFVFIQAPADDLHAGCQQAQHCSRTTRSISLLLGRLCGLLWLYLLYQNQCIKHNVCVIVPLYVIIVCVCFTFRLLSTVWCQNKFGVTAGACLVAAGLWQLWGLLFSCQAAWLRVSRRQERSWRLQVQVGRYANGRAPYALLRLTLKCNWVF